MTLKGGGVCNVPNVFWQRIPIQTDGPATENARSPNIHSFMFRWQQVLLKYFSVFTEPVLFASSSCVLS